MEDKLKTGEEIAAEYADILDRIVSLNKRLISELAQYRRMDEEEKEVAALLAKLGGDKRVGDS